MSAGTATARQSRTERLVQTWSWDGAALFAVYGAIALASIDVGPVFDVASATVKVSHLLFGVGLACALIAIVRDAAPGVISKHTKRVLVAVVILMATQVLSYVAGFPGAVEAAGRIAVMVGGAVVPLLAIVLTVNTREYFLRAVAVWLTAEFAFAIFGLYQLLSDPLGLPTPVSQIGVVAGAGRISSFSLEPGYYAAYVSTAIPVVAYMVITGRQIGPIKPWLLGSVLATVLVYANSRAGYLLALVTTIAALVLIFRARMFHRPAWRRIGALALATAVLLPVVALASGIEPSKVVASQVKNTVGVRTSDCAGADNNACTSNFVRSEIYKAGWRMFKEHPVFGIGDGRAGDELPAYGVDVFEGQSEATLQSVILEVGAETGLVGLAALAFLLWRLGALTLFPGREPPDRTEAWPARLMLLGAMAMIVIGGIVIMWLWDVRVWSLVGLGLAGLALPLAAVPAELPSERREELSAVPATG